jgi:hypothetical protein
MDSRLNLVERLLYTEYMTLKTCECCSLSHIQYVESTYLNTLEYFIVNGFSIFRNSCSNCKDHIKIMERTYKFGEKTKKNIIDIRRMLTF